MPRYFAPFGGFSDKKIVAIKVDSVDGYSTSDNVLADGTETPCGTVGSGNVWNPTWTVGEVEKLVAGGKWEELKEPPAKPDKAPAVAAPVTRVRQSPPAALPVIPSET